MSTIVNRNPAPASPRCAFQWKYAMQYAPSILNIGCSDDPLHFGDYAHHFDYDDWSRVHKRFTQGDAHVVDTYFPYGWALVIMGDIHEHLLDPLKATLAAARLCKQMLVMTIFEEWRLPGYGQWTKEGEQNAQAENERLGYKNGEDYQRKHYPLRTNGGEMPHLSHINQFTDEDIAKLVQEVCQQEGFEVVENTKVPEQTYDGHQWSNWLIALRRVGGDHARETGQVVEDVSRPSQEGIQ